MADSGQREDWRARAVRAEALLAEAVPMRLFEKAKAERDEWRDRQEQTSYVQQCVSDELVRTEARLAEALEALKSAAFELQEAFRCADEQPDDGGLQAWVAVERAMTAVRSGLSHVEGEPE